MDSPIMANKKWTRTKAERRQELWRKIKKNKWIYLMIAPGLLYFFVYKYIPMYGLIIAFQDYKPYLGITGSRVGRIGPFPPAVCRSRLLDDL